MIFAVVLVGSLSWWGIGQTRLTEEEAWPQPSEVRYDSASRISSGDDTALAPLPPADVDWARAHRQRLHWQEITPVFQLRFQDRKVTVCACAKCGTTAFFHAIYNLTHGTPWPYPGHKIYGLDRRARWTKAWGSRKAPRPLGRNGSLALVRDPRDRLISAWKNKATCAEGEGANVPDVARLVPRLLQLAAVPATGARTRRGSAGEDIPCLDLAAFVEVLFAIHARGKAARLDRHFRPQHLGCFLDHPPSEWGHVRTVGAPDLVCRLRALLLGRNATAAPDAADDCAARPRRNATRARDADLSPRHAAMLDALTREEYQALDPYL